MMIALYAVGFLFVSWFAWHTYKKISYFNEVEKFLKGRGIAPLTIQNKVGKQRYFNAMSFLKMRGIPPEETAGLLKMYVINGMGEYMQSPPTDFQEHRLLELLGYIKK